MSHLGSEWIRTEPSGKVSTTEMTRKTPVLDVRTKLGLDWLSKVSQVNSIRIDFLTNKVTFLQDGKHLIVTSDEQWFKNIQAFRTLPAHQLTDKYDVTKFKFTRSWFTRNTKQSSTATSYMWLCQVKLSVKVYNALYGRCIIRPYNDT